MPAVWLNHVKLKYNIASTRDFVSIVAVFCLAGLTQGIIARPILWFFGMTPETPIWRNILSYVVFVFPFYWIFLLVYGFIMGQGSFFWDREKRIFRRAVFSSEKILFAGKSLFDSPQSELPSQEKKPERL